MKIAVLAPVEEKVPPEKYGGTELVVYNLVEQLVKMGHNVTLLASGDSKTSAKLISIFPKSIRTLRKAQDIETRECLKYIGIGKVLNYLKQNKFDIVHNHIGWRLIPFQKFIDYPLITTIHGPLEHPSEHEIVKNYPKENYISISLNQQKSMPGINFVGNVYNGIETEKFRFSSEAKDYFAFLGRMAPEKGPLEAIQAIKKAKAKLIMAAKVDASDKDFFKKEIAPLIDGKQIKFIGEINQREKVEFLGSAKALVAPIQWEEPFGLYFVEAMICGTPVITFNRGSVPEVIKNRRTGFICQPNDINEMSEKIEKIMQMPKDKYQKMRTECRNHVEKNFSSVKMARNYLRVYQKIITQK